MSYYAELLDKAMDMADRGEEMRLTFQDKQERERWRSAFIATMRREKLKSQKLSMSDPAYGISPWEGLRVSREGYDTLVIGLPPKPVKIEGVKVLEK